MKKVYLKSRENSYSEAVIDNEDFEMIRHFSWHIIKTSNGFIANGVTMRNGKKISVYMHRLVLNAKRGYSIEHVDGNALNNQKYNLRITQEKDKKICSKCNTEKLMIDFRKERSQCKTCIATLQSEYKKLNSISILKKTKDYFDDPINKEKRKNYRKMYYNKNASVLNEKKKAYRQINKKEIRTYSNNYSAKRKSIDNLYKLTCSFRSMVSTAFKRKFWTKNNSTEKLLGCDFVFAKKYVEGKFKKGMKWGNYGEWHIDHIIPISAARTKEDLCILFHYSNLQPLWAKENIKKSNKILPIQMALTI